MENIFNMPFLEQMYFFRKEDIEQTIYENNNEIRKIEENIYTHNEELIALLRKLIPNKEDLKKVEKKLQDYELEFSGEVDFWSKAYYKLGMNDMYKLNCELKNETINIKKVKTFLDYVDGEFDNYMKDTLIYKTKNYQIYKEKLKDIAEKYPRVLKVHEEFTPIILNQEEMEQLMELKKLDAEVRAEEVKEYFKMGINKILNL